MDGIFVDVSYDTVEDERGVFIEVQVDVYVDGHLEERKMTYIPYQPYI